MHARNLMIFENGDHKAFQKWLNGDLDVTGWRSDWRKDIEAYFASKEPRKADKPAAAPVAKKAKKPRTRSRAQDKAEYMRKRRVWAFENHVCGDCYKSPAREGKTNCQPCQDRRTEREMRRSNERKTTQGDKCSGCANRGCGKSSLSPSSSVQQPLEASSLARTASLTASILPAISQTQPASVHLAGVL